MTTGRSRFPGRIFIRVPLWDTIHMDKNRCMACAKEGAFEGGICDLCKALIRGEALEQQHQIKKDADRSLHKEGTVIEKKTSPG